MESRSAHYRASISDYSAPRPEREVSRNGNGEIVCTHEACRHKTPTFARPYEWNKHMDRHERPYKCGELACVDSQGFTYSGGLLRHMREVHKREAGVPRQSRYCPHATCTRSTGEGFTRRENLEEHLRRRHISVVLETQPTAREAPGSRDTLSDPAFPVRNAGVQAALRESAPPTPLDSATQATKVVTLVPRLRKVADVAGVKQELKEAQQDIVCNEKTIRENNDMISSLKAQIEYLQGRQNDRHGRRQQED